MPTLLSENDILTSLAIVEAYPAEYFNTRTKSTSNNICNIFKNLKNLKYKITGRFVTRIKHSKPDTQRFSKLIVCDIFVNENRRIWFLIFYPCTNLLHWITFAIFSSKKYSNLEGNKFSKLNKNLFR